MIAKRVDRNQCEIVAALRAVGAAWIPTWRDPSIGFDGLILFRGRMYAAEIKDGDKSPCRRKLTKTESAARAVFELHGAPYLVLESVDDALRAIGAKRRVGL